MAGAAADPDGAGEPTSETACCIVGGGPAGLMLGLLLARRSVPVTVLEAHHDLDRDFRGDTIHPSTLEVLDQIGLSDRVHRLPHGKLRRMKIVTPEGEQVLAEFGRLDTKFPYVMMMPQVKFLDLLAEEARRCRGFELVHSAFVHELVREGGRVCGVRYIDGDRKRHHVHAHLTVAADGRHSKIRSLLGLEPVRTSPPMDVLWFRLPRRDGDPHDEGGFYIHGGHLAVLLEREAEWQVGFVILKGGYQQVKAAGLDVLKRLLVETVPWMANRVAHLEDWKQVHMLSVESSRLRCWHVPGLICIGDAAHVMSPVGGVGINYAIQDAVEAANLLAGPLARRDVTEAHLAGVQRARELPVRVIQTFQGFIQQRIVAQALDQRSGFELPLVARIALRVPLVRDLPARMVAFGIRRVRVQDPGS
jgi:2-polyprenyl-6-methoxyphenol hydroxylase-like FAD-dependent oxidoreductase